MHEICRPRRLIEGLGVFGLGVALSSWVIDRESHGWYRYYTVFLPAHQAWNSHKLVTFLLRDIVDPLGLAIVFVMVGVGLYMSTVSKDRGETNFLVFTTIGVTVSSLTARLHMGGSINVTLPLYAWICILFGLCLHLVLSLLSEGAPDEMLPEEEEFLKDVTAAAALAYPKQERLLSPSEAKDFFTNSITSKIKPQFLYLPR
jgi:hypothetical protein